MIGMQRLGHRVELVPDTGIPSGDEANRLTLASSWNVNLLPTCWIIGIQMENGSSPPVSNETDLYLWARDHQWDVWGRLGENNGAMNGGETFAFATLFDGWWFVYQNLEVWKDLYLQQDDQTGSPKVTCFVYPMYEMAVELRGL